MAELRKGLMEALTEYESLVSQLQKEVYPEESAPLTRSAALLDKDQHCGVLLSKLSAADEKLKAKFALSVPVCSSSKATSSGTGLATEQIRGVQKDLLEAQQCMGQAIFKAQKQLEAVRQSERGSVSADNLIKFAHRISQANSVAAPVGWGPGDPRRPYPSDFEMRIGSLGSIGASNSAESGAETAVAQPMDVTRAPNKMATDPIATGSSSTSAAVTSSTNGNDHVIAAAPSSSGLVAQWQPPAGFASDDDVSTDSSDSSSNPHSHEVPPAQLLLPPTAVCNGDDGNNPASSDSSTPSNPGTAGRLSAGSSSSSSSSDDD